MRRKVLKIFKKEIGGNSPISMRSGFRQNFSPPGKFPDDKGLQCVEILTGFIFFIHRDTLEDEYSFS